MPALRILETGEPDLPVRGIGIRMAEGEPGFACDIARVGLPDEPFESGLELLVGRRPPFFESGLILSVDGESIGSRSLVEYRRSSLKSREHAL